MKKGIAVLLCVSMVLAMAACSSPKTTGGEEADSQTEQVTEEEKVDETEKNEIENVEEESGDVLFVQNLAKALEARWAITEKTTEAELLGMSVSETQKYRTETVNAELNELGKLEDYDFSDDELKKLAEIYFKGINLQKEGIQYSGTTDYAKEEKTWGMGYNYRTVAINEIYLNYDLTVSEEYKKILDDFAADSTVAKRSIAIQEFADNLALTLEYEIDEGKSDEYSTYYTSVIENTTEYDISSLEIDVDFVDADGVVVYQSSDWFQNFKSGSKIKSEIDYYPEDGEFDHMEFTISAYAD